MSFYNKLVGGPKWLYEGAKEEYRAGKEEFINVVGGAGNYVVDSVSAIFVGGGQAVEDVGKNVSAGFIEAPIQAVAQPIGQLGKDLTIPLLIGAAFLLLKK